MENSGPKTLTEYFDNMGNQVAQIKYELTDERFKKALEIFEDLVKKGKEIERSLLPWGVQKSAESAKEKTRLLLQHIDKNEQGCYRIDSCSLIKLMDIYHIETGMLCDGIYKYHKMGVFFDTKESEIQNLRASLESIGQALQYWKPLILGKERKSLISSNGNANSTVSRTYDISSLMSRMRWLELMQNLKENCHPHYLRAQWLYTTLLKVTLPEERLRIVNDQLVNKKSEHQRTCFSRFIHRLSWCFFRDRHETLWVKQGDHDPYEETLKELKNLLEPPIISP